ncbi:MAG: Loki-CTERM sorting domain-containing protein [Candidatus Bathyarchaeia archaeon]
MRKTRLCAMIIGISLIALAVSAVPATAQMGVWRDINPDAYISPPANPQLNSVYMFSSAEGWAVGDSYPTTNTTTALPAIFHYDGSTWNLVPTPKIPDFSSTQSPYNLTSISFGAPGNFVSKDDGWAVGFNNIIPGSSSCATFPTLPLCPTALAIHWDGTTWRSQLAGLSGVNAGQLWSDFMVSSTNVWAVGQDQAGANGIFWHWTGTAGLGGGWNMPQAAVPCPTLVAKGNCGIYSVFMVSSTEGWAVGAGGMILHYFGVAWNTFTSPIPCTATSCISLRSVFMISPTEGWAVGDGGIIIHYSGGIWSGPVSPGTTSNNLFSVFMVSSTEGWAFGAKGSILHYSGGAWTLLSSNLVPTSPVSLMNFNSGFFNSANDGWVVGTNGVIVHFDGVNYGTVTSPTINNFTSISFGPPLTGPINPSDGWAVGNSSVTDGVTPNEPTIYHWNGFAWTKGVAIGTTNNLNSVFMINTGDVWAVGGGPHPTASCSSALCPIILHFTGGSWNTITPPPGSYSLKSIFMVSSDEGWAVGEQVAQLTCTPPSFLPGCYPTGIILHYTVTGGVGTWAVFPAPSSPAAVNGLQSVFMLNQNEGWAVGDNATILHYTVSGGIGTWNLVAVSGSPTLSLDANLTSIFMLSPTSGWAVGGNSWQAGSSFSAGPVILYWDGTVWEPVAVPSIPGGTTPTGHTSATLKSVFFSAPDDGWAVGFPGKLVATILHWDGFSWEHVTLSPALLGQTPPILTSVYMTSETDGWIVGGSPDFKYCTSPPFTSSTSSNSCYFLQTAPLGTAPNSFGYKTPLSTILRFSPFGGIFSTTSTSIVVSTISTSTTALTTTISSTTTPVCPPNVTISIKVVDNQGNPLSGVNVVLTPPAFTPCLAGPLQSVTDSSGLVTFMLPPGTYTITLTKNGVTSTQPITVVSSGQMFTLPLNVSPGGMIPGFPLESILAGIVVGVGTLVLLRRRRAN